MSANSSSKLTKEFTKQKSSSLDSDSNSNTTKSSNCSCNNISIMHLFHEMKQKFPTVPDNIVNECATENCHNREKCIAALEREILAHPNTAQSYPSQVIRNNGTGSPLLLKPHRPAPLSPSTSNSSTSSASNACDNNVVRPQISPKPQVKRPTTLDIVKKYPADTAKPIRRAPPLPPHRPPHHDNQSTNTSSFGDSTSSLTSPSDFSDSLHSPSTSSASTSEHNSCVKRLADGKVSSYVHFNPEPAYTQFLGKTISPTNPNCFTSVNFSLRPPSDTPQNPIEIHARPDSGLSYSSVSFNPKEGLKNQLQIHVNDKYGQFTISQIHQRTSPTNPYQPQIMPPGGEVMGNNGGKVDVVTGHIMKQRSQKDKLALAVAEEEQKYKHVLEEIAYLESPFDPEEHERLDATIRQLYKEIQHISNLPDNSCGIDINGQPISSPHQFLSQNTQECSSSIHENQLSQSLLHSSSNVNHSTSFNDSSNLDDEAGPPWTCRSCTFQNHALLQKCETCDTVRVLPGTIRITSSSSQPNDGGNSSASSALASFLTNNDTPPYTALHT